MIRLKKDKMADKLVNIVTYHKVQNQFALLGSQKQKGE